ncbi:hypothetical protein OAQ40_02115 [Euryarchaeota archaeon]|nr:hypothetical protein [Euryarchaeota archaeon]
MAEKRDPRAHWLDEDPFDQMDTKSKTHTRARDDGNWRKPHIRVVTGNPSGQPFFRVFGAQQSQPIPLHKGSIWHFSEKEIKDLSNTIIAFTIALGFFATNGIFGALKYPLLFVWWGILLLIPTIPAFLLHEIAHKITARKYGCWAEFRSSASGLRVGIFIAALTGILFMAPGAVMVAGNTTKSQFGKIALAGPVSNVILWILGIFLILLGFETSGVFTVPFAGVSKGMLWWWMWGNAALAVFNMLPFGPLDGKKIKTWSETMFWFWLIVAGSLIWFNINYLPALL